MSFFAVKCRKNGYFHTFLGHSCCKAAVIGGKGSNTNGLALGRTLAKIEWSRHHSVSFFAVKCCKNGYFHTFLSRKCFKTALKGSKKSNTNRLALEQILTKNRVKPLSFSVIFSRKMP